MQKLTIGQIRVDFTVLSQVTVFCTSYVPCCAIPKYIVVVFIMRMQLTHLRPGLPLGFQLLLQLLDASLKYKEPSLTTASIPSIDTTPETLKYRYRDQTCFKVIGPTSQFWLRSGIVKPRSYPSCTATPLLCILCLLVNRFGRFITTVTQFKDLLYNTPGLSNQSQQFV